MESMAYYEPASVEEAVALLARDEEARCLAGGATLVAMMNARLVAPGALVSLRRVRELDGIEVQSDGSLRIGAMTRHRATAADDRLVGSWRIVREAAMVIANPTVRNMGTMGGSIAFADPAADYPSALVAAGAEIEIAGPAGRRRIAADDFFVDWYETAVEPGELVAGILLPSSPPGAAGHYDKLARVEGDFATVSVAVCLAVEARVCSHVRIAVGGCGPRPVRLADAERRLLGGGLDKAEVEAVGALLAEASDPVDDVRASADYRRLVIPRMVGRAVATARSRLEADA